ncbi:AAA family ATPase [Oculatella sp. FACHB-28]|uniref:AAA family ATPase n=1 Tax=Oculatella sp. FACHB-28 TaxID=2692845 RepID=UPI001688A1FB|nr:AAA family ATPase [Oculatella sp. FACHB-28]MBD2059528.1 AAA family ATPase [Oculatella sp. FACHB-28]
MNFDPELCRNESEVESKLIVQYLLPELGYSPDTWHQEVTFGNIRLDFLAFATQVLPFVLDATSPLSVVMEAKHPDQNLDKHVRRLKKYLTSLNVEYGLLSNGKEIRIYRMIGNDINLTFQCFGREIVNNIEIIRNIIGRNSLRERNNKNSLTDAKPSNSETELDLKKSSKLERRSPVKVIAIYHNKGGVGKTTVSVNLSAALRNKGHKVLLIDLDSQANTTFAAGLVKFQFEEDDDLKDNNVFHVLESSDFFSIPDVSRQSHFFNNPEFDVIPSHIILIEKQSRLTAISASKTRLIKKLKQVQHEYDFVIIDTPPSRDLYAEVAMIAADYLIIPSDLKPFANQGLSSVKGFLKQVDEFREMVGKQPIQILGVLPSKISTNTKFLQATFPKQRKTILDHYNLSLMKSVIFERAALSHCLNQTLIVGDMEVPDPKSIFEHAEGNASARQSADEFEDLAKEVLEKVGIIQ